MGENDEQDMLLTVAAISIAAEALIKLLQTGQAQTITMDQVRVKMAQNTAAHDKLQNTP